MNIKPLDTDRSVASSFIRITAYLLIAIAPIVWQEKIIIKGLFAPILPLALFSLVLSLLACFVCRRSCPVFIVSRKAVQILDVCSVLLFAALLPLTIWSMLKANVGSWLFYVETTVLCVWTVWLFLSLCQGNTAKSLVALVFFFCMLVYATRAQLYSLPLPLNQLLTIWLLPVLPPIVFLLLAAFLKQWGQGHR